MLAWLLGVLGTILLAVLTYIVKRNDASNAKVVASVGELTTEVAVLRTHLFGATGTNGLNSRVLRLEEAREAHTHGRAGGR